MAKFREYTEEHRARIDAWLATRPTVIQELAAQFTGDRLYRLKSTGHRVTIYSYLEDGTMTVLVTGKYNRVMFERRVFGIKPEELVECDLPSENEVLGTILTVQGDIDDYLAVKKREVADG